MSEQKIGQNPYILHTFRSPFSRVTEVNRSDSSVIGDWNRGLDIVLIDGCLLRDLIKKYKKNNNKDVCFTDLNDLRGFFKQHLLKDVPGEKQEKALDEAMIILHQGGVLSPISAAAFEAVTSKGLTLIESGRQPRTNFITTDKGFRVQEIVTQKKLLSSEWEPILPDPGKEYVYQAQATIDVDLSANEASYRIINNTVSYGSSLVKSKLDERSFLQKVYNFFERLFGIPSVEPVEDLGVSRLGGNS